MDNVDLIKQQIDKKLMIKDTVIIAIDGRAGSGKTTLSNYLKDEYNAQIIHMDFFFLPLNFRTKERYDEIGGNIHYERFYDEVTKNIKKSIDFKYRVYSCKDCDYISFEEIKYNGLIIVEGVYSMHHKLNMDYDLSIFIDIDNNLQKQRIIKRNGIDMYKNFKEIWIPLENIYFDKYNIKEKSDIIIKMT